MEDNPKLYKYISNKTIFAIEEQFFSSVAE